MTATGRGDHAKIIQFLRYIWATLGYSAHAPVCLLSWAQASEDSKHKVQPQDK